MLDRFAEQLRKARLKKGVTLQQIAAITRIDIKFLEALDNGNFGFLPDLYIKAFIKQYAKAVDLEEQETVKKYEDALAGKYIEEEEPKSLLEQKVEISNTQQQTEDEKQIPIFDGGASDQRPPVKSNDITKKLRVLVYAAGFVLVGVVVFFALFNRHSTIIVEEIPYEKILEKTQDRYQVKDEKVDSSEILFNSDSLTLQFVNADSVDSAWVMVITDDLKKEDFLLYPRISKSMIATDNFKFTLGNSGVIILKLDNELLNFEGKRGSVRHYEVTRKGIQRLNSPPVLTAQ
ncbi:MAG: helix-turn-helix domain-containing protein [Ignavibacteriaceae bacterium]|jgi:transcriptional regulator with XRE-family HTH domain|nr:helix-turn-helix domain-containing protein [Ignavibacteriaceae bacterium]MCW9064729.1 helix-turn-helix domain-containing protein [Ignavibacteriaceae bacterium]